MYQSGRLEYIKWSGKPGAIADNQFLLLTYFLSERKCFILWMVLKSNILKKWGYKIFSWLNVIINLYYSWSVFEYRFLNEHVFYRS